LALVPALIPSSRVLTHPFAIDPLWRALEEGQPPPAVAADPEALLVWRQDIAVYHRPLEDDERDVLSLIDGRRCLRALCDALPGGIDEAALRLFNLLGRWMADGLLVAAAER